MEFVWLILIAALFALTVALVVGCARLSARK